jgi:hypothetical protein
VKVAKTLDKEPEGTLVPDEDLSYRPVIESSPKQDSGEITIGKYFQLHDPNFNVYQRAYAEARFRGIMKSKESWEDAIHTLMEGEK